MVIPIGYFANRTELKAMADNLRRASEEMGPSINLSKTKIMTNIPNLEKIKVNGVEIEEVSEYRYLGQIIPMKNKTDKELKIRRANAWKAFWAHILQSNLKMKSKVRIFESRVVPFLLYGAQTWVLSAKQLEKLQTTQNSMLRNLLKVRLKDEVSIAYIYQKTNARRVQVTARTLKLRYAGHMFRDNKLK